MTDTITLRRATEADAPALALIGAATFLETYAHMIPGPDLIAHCRDNHAASLYAQWAADPHTTIWLAEHAATAAPVGYLVLRPASLPKPAPNPHDREVLRIYVLSRFHRTGTGHRLMQAAIAACQKDAVPRLVLGTHQENHRALAFYARQGFAVIDGRRFQVGTSVFCDHVLARTLTASAPEGAQA